ncbi:MAG: polysaccharide biosynthesis tyrosine autokinase [Elainellaceae cyanobacterium]
MVHAFKILKRRALLIGGSVLTVAAATLAWTVFQSPLYRGEFRVLIESTAETVPSQESSKPENQELTVDYDTQIEVLKSQALLSPIAQSLQEQYPSIDSRILATNLTIARVRDTKILAISYEDSDPELVQAVLDESAQQFLDYSLGQYQANSQQGVEFVDDRLPELRAEVDDLEDRLERFRQRYSLFDPASRGQDLSELLSSVEAQRQALQTELAQARSLFQTLQTQLSATPSDALASTALSESPRYQALLGQVKDLEAQIAVESARYQFDSPQMQALRERRDNLLPLLEEEASQILGRSAVGSSVDSGLTPTSIDLSRQLIDVANQIETLQARSQSLAQVEQNLKQEFETVPALEREYSELQRELDIATQNLNRFLEARETLQIDAAQSSVPWELIARPQTSSRPISPNLWLNLSLGAIAGLLLGIAAALFMEKLDQVFHSAEELEGATRSPVLGTIPYLPTLRKRSPFLEPAHPSRGQAAPGAQADFRESIFLEAFRSLHTSIRFLDRSIRATAITSSTPGEGKSTVAAGLASAAAVMGQRTLLVDADLRAPKQHSQMGISNYPGLSNVISESIDINAAIRQSSVDPNLFVLTSGTAMVDPANLLSSPLMQALMQQLQQAYDFVVYDTPPTAGFSDSRLVSAHVDGLLLVVGLGKAERSLVKPSLERLTQSSTPLIGLVANGIRPYTTQGYTGYYQHYQSPAKATAHTPPSPTVTAHAGPPAVMPHTLVPHPPPTEVSALRPSTLPPTETGTVQAAIAPITPPVEAQASAAPILSPVEAERSRRSTKTLSMPETPIGWPWLAGSAVSVLMLVVVCSFALVRIMAEAPAAQNDIDAENTAPEKVISDNADVSETNQAEPSPQAQPPHNAEESSAAGEPIESGSAPPEAQTGGQLSVSEETQDPFTEAVNVAQEAVTAGSDAQTPQEWSQITDLWQSASALMSAVPEDDPRFDLARDRAVIYRNNGEYARQRTLSLQDSPQ